MIDIYSEKIKKIDSFLNTKGKRFLFYHRDADGVSSAALMLKFFPVLIPVPRRGPRLESEFVDYLIEQKPDLVIFLDLPIDQEWKRIDILKKKLPDMRILIIDHHIPEKNLNSKNVVHFNPKFRHDVYLPASYLVYRILGKLGKSVGSYVWIACIGVIGDYGFNECKDLMKECKKVSPDLLKQDPFKSKLGRGVELISAAITLKGLRGADNALEILIKSDSYEDFAHSGELSKWKSIVDREFKNILNKFESEKKKVKKHKQSESLDIFPELNLIIYTIKTRLSMTSSVSSVIAIENPKKTVVIVRKSGDEWKLSMRNQTGNVNLNKIVKKCVKDIGSGGGHIKAAGALVKDFEEFKKRFINELSSS